MMTVMMVVVMMRIAMKKQVTKLLALQFTVHVNMMIKSSASHFPLKIMIIFQNRDKPPTLVLPRKIKTQV
jgi:hypothetical protein